MQNRDESNLEKISGWFFGSFEVIVFIGLLLWIFINSFYNALCEDVSICYTIAIFLVGIIITLKMAILNEKNKGKDLILFIIWIVINVFVFMISYYSFCKKEYIQYLDENQNKINILSSVIMLNVLIWLDFIVLIRNTRIAIVVYWKKHLRLNPKEYKKDLFEKNLLRTDKSQLICRALTSNSYRNVDKSITDHDINEQLGTYGDSLIKTCFAKLLLDKTDKLSVEIEKYITDEIFVKVIAKKYSLLDYIKYDKDDEKIVRNYEYIKYPKTKGKNKKDSPHKYIATAVEALIGAIYLETNNLEKIIKICEKWKSLIDSYYYHLEQEDKHNYDLYLVETKLLDYKHPSIQKLIKDKKWMELDDFNKIKSIYNYVRDGILFGYNIDDNIKASKVLKDGYGQCNTKGILFMALLRGVGIPCRVHGFTIDKILQKGAMTGLVYKKAPNNVFHSWVEVLYNDQWFELEGFILDKKYLTNLQSINKDIEGKFIGYGVAVDDFKNPIIDFDGNNTYIQSKGINQDFGIYDTPDELLKEHHQEMSNCKRLLYRHYGRHMMNFNVGKIRDFNFQKESYGRK